MSYYPIIVVLILAILDWIAAEKKIKPLEYVAKPATMLALLWWMWQSVGLGGSMLWFTLGAIFCLAGDVFLMIPRDMFIFGLLAFLVGHVFYVIGLNNIAPYINLWGGILIILLGVYLWWLYPKLAGGLNEKGKSSIKNPCAYLFTGDQPDGLFCPDDLDTIWLAYNRSIICQPRCSIILRFRFDAGMGSVYKSTLTCPFDE